MFVFLVKFWELIGLHCCNYCHLPSDFPFKFNHPWQYFITSCWQKKVEFYSSIIHDNICSLIHKQCHPKSYHSDIKYHMSLASYWVYRELVYTIVYLQKNSILGSWTGVSIIALAKWTCLSEMKGHFCQCRRWLLTRKLEQLLHNFCTHMIKTLWCSDVVNSNKLYECVYTCLRVTCSVSLHMLFGT